MNTPHLRPLRRLGLSRNINRDSQTPTSTPKNAVTGEKVTTEDAISMPIKTEENKPLTDVLSDATNSETVVDLSIKSTKLNDTSQSTDAGNSETISIKTTEETSKNTGNSKKVSSKSKTKKQTRSKNAGDSKQLSTKSTTLEKTPAQPIDSKNPTKLSIESSKCNETPIQNSRSLSIKSTNSNDMTQLTNSGNSVNLSINSTNLNETPVSTKPFKFKLSLSKAIAQAETRKRTLSLEKELMIQPKRLKLHLGTDEIQSDDSNSLDQSDACDAKLSVDKEEVETSAAVLQAEIDELKKTIAAIEKHEKRSTELVELIAKWQEAGRKTIYEIEEKLEPKQDIRTILDHFHIDPGLFNIELPD